MAHLKPFQLLEINIISAQDLEPVSRNMRTYATAWVHPKRKLSTSVDAQGRHSPTWNDKFVFRVDDEFLRMDNSAVMIEIYAVHWLRDTLVGTVRVLVGNLVTPPTRSHFPNQHHIGMRFVALQVRRPSGRPQGILNIGVAVLDSSMRSMPLYTQLSTSAVGYRDLMDDDHLNNHGHQATIAHQNINNRTNVKPILRRSKSERSERVTFDDISTANGSILALKEIASSLLSESTINPSKGKGKKGKASSVISGAELREKPRERGKKGKASSVIGSITSKDPNKTGKPNSSDTPKENKIPSEKPRPVEPKIKNKKGDEKEKIPSKDVQAPTTAIGKPISDFKGFDYGGPKGSSIVNGKYIYRGPVAGKANSFWSDSEVGPSPSEVAAVIARERYPVDDNQSSVLDGWSLDESVEGLRSKLERWRTELPPLYDRSGLGSSSFRSTSQHQHLRRHSDDGGLGLFSCFGNIYGYECQCICGKPPDGRRSLGSRIQSPSASAGRPFV